LKGTTNLFNLRDGQQRKVTRCKPPDNSKDFAVSGSPESVPVRQERGGRIAGGRTVHALSRFRLCQAAAQIRVFGVRSRDRRSLTHQGISLHYAGVEPPRPSMPHLRKAKRVTRGEPSRHFCRLRCRLSASTAVRQPSRAGGMHAWAPAMHLSRLRVSWPDRWPNIVGESIRDGSQANEPLSTH